MEATAKAAPASLVRELEARTRTIRVATVRMAHTGKTPHVGSALSSVEILATLYFHAMNIEPQSRERSDQDRFILSKGHGCMSYYATLAERGYFPREWLATYAQNGGKLAEHPSPTGIPGVDVATGSLGHGLAVGAGMAIARRLAGRGGRIFVLMSDGECNEGSVWETAMFAAKQKLDALVAIVDYNKLQAMGRTDEITALEPLAEKWRAFGWETREVDGHDLSVLARTFDAIPFASAKPSAVIAHTVKGKGVSFMENDPEWHYRPPSAAELEVALAEIQGTGFRVQGGGGSSPNAKETIEQEDAKVAKRTPRGLSD